MARSEARLSVDIWNDPDFRALSRDAQWAFMFLLSQHDLAHDGVIALRVRRWAQSAAGLTVQVIGEALRELERTRFVVIDRDCEELLIRSFIRRDKVYKQPNVLRAAADHLPLVASPVIRHALAVELTRVQREPMPEGSAALVEAMLKALPNPSDNPSGNPSPDPSGKASAGTPGERGMVTVVSNGFPVPRSPIPRTPPPADGEPPSTTNALVAEWLSNCRSRPAAKTIAIVGKQVKALLSEGLDPDHVRGGLEAWRAKGADPSTLHSFVNQVMNAEPRASPNGLVEHNGMRLKPETAQRLQDRARFEAMDAQQLAIEGPT